MQRFNEKLVVISGGASGMGALTAKRVVEEGGTAITLDINDTLGQEVANEIGNKVQCTVATFLLHLGQKVFYEFQSSFFI